MDARQRLNGWHASQAELLCQALERRAVASREREVLVARRGVVGRGFDAARRIGCPVAAEVSLHRTECIATHEECCRLLQPHGARWQREHCLAALETGEDASAML